MREKRNIHTLKTQVEKALGPQSEVREIKVGLNAVEILGLRIKAPPREEGSISSGLLDNRDSRCRPCSARKAIAPRSMNLVSKPSPATPFQALGQR